MSGDDVREHDGELDLRDYLAVFRRRWRWTFVTAALVVGLVTLFSLTRDEVYRTGSTVQILTSSNQTVFNVGEESLYRGALAELQYVSGSRFETAVNEAAGHEVDFTSGAVRVDDSEKAEDAGVIRFIVEAPTAARAQTGADAAAQVYLDERLRGLTGSFESRRQQNVDARSVLQGQRADARADIAAADAAAAAALDPFQQVELEATRDDLVSELNPVIEGLNQRIGALNAEIAATDRLLAILAEPDSTARVLSPAGLPRNPVSPDVTRNIMIAAVVGLVLGLILAMLRDLLDPRVRDGAELARLLDVPVMATVDKIRSQRSAPGGVRRFTELSPQEASGYHVLLNSLWLSNVLEPLRSVVFTSDRPGAGKTQTVINLAQAEAARGTRVLIIDADFVQPSVASRLELERNGLGLSDLLSGSDSIESVAIRTTVGTLDVVDTHKGAFGNDLLRSDRFGTLLTELSARYDLILIDAMPTLSASDSRLVALQADAVVVVYDSYDSRREDLQQTIDLLRNSGANLVGLVANRSRPAHPVYLAKPS